MRPGSGVTALSRVPPAGVNVLLSPGSVNDHRIQRVYVSLDLERNEPG